MPESELGLIACGVRVYRIHGLTRVESEYSRTEVESEAGSAPDSQFKLGCLCIRSLPLKIVFFAGKSIDPRQDNIVSALAPIYASYTAKAKL